MPNLFIALDTADISKAKELVTRLGSHIQCYKIGLELLFSGGLDFAVELKQQGKTVFLDMKLLDIPTTVEKAVANISRLGLDYLTVHGTDTKTLEAAVRGRGTSNLKLLAVTVLTSLDQLDLIEQGISNRDPASLVVRRAQLAKAAGFDGVIASGHETAAVRADVGPDFLIFTPGIRLAENDNGDQIRVMTPVRAIRAGASHLVVGRPITESCDPVASAKLFLV